MRRWRLSAARWRSSCALLSRNDASRSVGSVSRAAGRSRASSRIHPFAARASASATAIIKALEPQVLREDVDGRDRALLGDLGQGALEREVEQASLLHVLRLDEEFDTRVAGSSRLCFGGTRMTEDGAETALRFFQGGRDSVESSV